MFVLCCTYNSDGQERIDAYDGHWTDVKEDIIAKSDVEIKPLSPGDGRS